MEKGMLVSVCVQFLGEYFLEGAADVNGHEV